MHRTTSLQPSASKNGLAVQRGPEQVGTPHSAQPPSARRPRGCAVYVNLVDAVGELEQGRDARRGTQERTVAHDELGKEREARRLEADSMHLQAAELENQDVGEVGHKSTARC